MLDENEYAVYGAAELDARSTKSFEVYSYDEDALKVSKVFVMRGAGVTGNVDELLPVLTVSRGKLSYDELLEEAVWEVSGTMDGGQMTVTPKNDTVDTMLRTVKKWRYSSGQYGRKEQNKRHFQKVFN